MPCQITEMVVNVQMKLDDGSVIVTQVAPMAPPEDATVEGILEKLKGMGENLQAKHESMLKAAMESREGPPRTLVMPNRDQISRCRP